MDTAGRVTRNYQKASEWCRECQHGKTFPGRASPSGSTCRATAGLQRVAQPLTRCAHTFDQGQPVRHHHEAPNWTRVELPCYLSVSVLFGGPGCQADLTRRARVPLNLGHDLRQVMIRLGLSVVSCLFDTDWGNAGRLAQVARVARGWTSWCHALGTTLDRMAATERKLGGQSSRERYVVRKCRHGVWKNDDTCR